VTQAKSFGLRIAAFALLAAVTYRAPSDGALGLLKILAWAAYLCVLALPSPCKSGAAYPFGHGFRRGGACRVPIAGFADQSESGAISTEVEAVLAPSTRLPSARTAPDATSRSAMG
jgi:hypothetical protein